MLFAQSSERRTPGADKETKEKAPKTGHGPREQSQLRLIVDPHTLDVSDRTCSVCNGALEEMGDQAEESEEVDVIAREFVRRKHVRKKYRCRCGACVETAPMPPRLVPGGRYSLAFAIAVAISKYADHLPLERQVRVLLDEPVLFADETPWPLLGKNESSSKWHAWMMASPKGAYYDIHDTRGLSAGKALLTGFKGIAVTDGYGVYDALEKRFASIRIAQCWAHIRRKFVDCESAFPKETEQILALIRELYAIEERAPPGPEGDAARLQLRTTESRCVLARIQRGA